MLLMVATGFGSGLPYMLTATTLTAWLTEEHLNTGDIGLLSLVSLPYSLKFLWAPLLDRYSPGFLGRRRGWMVLCQLALSAATAALGLFRPHEAPITIAALALLVAFVSASLDVVVDGHRVEYLRPEERSQGTAAFVFGYRSAMLVSGALGLRMADWLGDFRYVYFAMAALMLPTALLLALSPDAPSPLPPQTLRESVVEPFRDYLRRPAALTILGFVLAYRLSDVIASTLTPTFVLQSGYSNTELADATKFMGLAASIVGALAAARFMDRIGLYRSLFLFGILQAVTNLGYARLASVSATVGSTAGRSLPLLYAVVAADQFCSGLAIAAFSLFLLTLCNPRYGATQTALLTSASRLAGRLLAGASGFVAAKYGWPTFFLATTALGAPALVLLALLHRNMSTGVVARTAAEAHR